MSKANESRVGGSEFQLKCCCPPPPTPSPRHPAPLRYAGREGGEKSARLARRSANGCTYTAIFAAMPLCVRDLAHTSAHRYNGGASWRGPMSIIASVDELEAIYGQPNDASTVKVADRITPEYRKLIAASPFVALATAGRRGSTARRAGTWRASCACTTSAR